MPNATVTQSTLLGGFNQASLVAQIKTVMGQAGWTFDSEVAGSPHQLVFRRVFNAGATYGTVYAVMRIPAAAGGTQQFGASYRANAADVQPNNMTFSTWSVDQTWFAVNHPEVSGFVVRQGSTRFAILWVRPSNIPSWWSENAYCYGFMYGLSAGIFAAATQPASLGISTSLQRATTSVNATNPRNGGLYEIQTDVRIIGDSTAVAYLSPEIVTACYPTASIGAGDDLIVSAGVQEYFVWGDGLAIRKV